MTTNLPIIGNQIMELQQIFWIATTNSARGAERTKCMKHLMNVHWGV